MKKKILTALAVLSSVFCFSGCSIPQDVLDKFSALGGGKDSLTEESVDLESMLSASPDSSVEKPNSSEEPDSSIETPDSSEEPDSSIETPDSSEEPDSSSEDIEIPPEPEYLYHAFTPSEKQVCEEYLGVVLPFVANNEYYLETSETEDGTWVNFYTIGNTKSEFDAYHAEYKTYTFIETYKDDYGDTWYCYEKGDLYLEIAYYLYEGEYWIDVYAIAATEDDGGNGGTDGDEYTYYDFTDEEKALFTQYVGEVIPFLPNDEYYVEGYYEVDDYENGMCFYTCGVTQVGFALYRGMYSDYDYAGEWTDEEGDTWYTYEKGDLLVDMVYYYYEGEYWMEVYVSVVTDDDSGNGGNNGGNGGGSDTDADLITNDGKGLPTDASGVYNVDFTKAEYVKDVTEQGYYLDGCPTKGDVKVLVIPVEFSDVTAASKGYSLEKLDVAFNGAVGSCEYYSVKEYYAQSSYNQLNLDFVVLDNWFRPVNDSSYYANATIDYYGSETAIGDQLIMDEALAYLESRIDLSQFDLDGNTVIDAVIMVNTLDIDAEADFQWAYRYWNIYTDADGYYYEYDGVSANDYLWAPYQFLLETYDEDGEVYYDDNVLNTYTFIHEFGHVLGADDYYDTSYVGAPMNGLDIMDSMMGDHNAYTKFNYGWLSTSRLVVAEESITLTLDAFAKAGDTILIANNWDDALGAYQEYFIVVYYTQESLNGGDYGYFVNEGIIVYHVNASLCKDAYDDEVYYDVYNNNTDGSDSYGTADNLIEFVKTDDDHYVHLVGESMSANATTDAGEKVAYTFTVDALDGETATLTFTKNK